MLALLVIYALIGAGAAALAYLADDPYGHLGQAHRACSAALVGVCWAPLLIYAMALLAWDFVRTQLDPRD